MLGKGRDSSIHTVTGYRLKGGCLISGRGKICLHPTASRPLLGPTQPLIQWTIRTLSSGCTDAGALTDHLSPSSAEVKNDGAM
jgi:hypothetical protein